MQRKMLKIPIRITLNGNRDKTTKDADIQYDIYKVRNVPKAFGEAVSKIIQNHTRCIDNWGKLTKSKTL